MIEWRRIEEFPADTDDYLLMALPVQDDWSVFVARFEDGKWYRGDTELPDPTHFAFINTPENSDG